MKVSKEEYQLLLGGLRQVVADREGYNKLWGRYQAGEFVRSELVKDLEVRFRWDLLWMCKRCYPDACVSMWEYLDNHIDTALRKAVGELAKEAGAGS